MEHTPMQVDQTDVAHQSETRQGVDQVGVDRPVGELEEWVAFLATLNTGSRSHQDTFHTWCENWLIPLRSLRDRLDAENQLLPFEIINTELDNVERCFAVLADAKITTVRDLAPWYFTFTNTLKPSLDVLLNFVYDRRVQLLAMDEVRNEGEEKMALNGVPGLALLATTKVFEQVTRALAVLVDVLETYPARGVAVGPAARQWPIASEVNFAMGNLKAQQAPKDAQVGVPANPPDRRRQDCEKLRRLIHSARDTLHFARRLGSKLIKLVTRLHANECQDFFRVTPWATRIRERATSTNDAYERLRKAADTDIDEQAWTALTAATEHALFEECEAYWKFTHFVTGESDASVADYDTAFDELTLLHELERGLANASSKLSGLAWNGKGYSLAFTEKATSKSVLTTHPISFMSRKLQLQDKGVSYLDAAADIPQLIEELQSVKKCVESPIVPGGPHMVQIFTDAIQFLRVAKKAILDILTDTLAKLREMVSPEAVERPTRRRLAALMQECDKQLSEQVVALADSVSLLTGDENPMRDYPKTLSVEVLALMAGTWLESIRSLDFGSSTAPYAQAQYKLKQWRDSFDSHVPQTQSPPNFQPPPNFQSPPRF